MQLYKYGKVNIFITFEQITGDVKLLTLDGGEREGRMIAMYIVNPGCACAASGWL